ncbi:hypothetical protein B0T18DRAFT_357155 [Schizothecium vesticola]|uniref:Uncharacterized protein n=1 Tax=Schizothecium vesticola TaxID=314040 RepID=A0AA40KBG5_9PEZI|nr:hypothetical protein B0T18DRAFT_357155 [Schizothecium vesticola]
MQTFTLLALASSALAAHIPRGGAGWGEVTTHIATTYTTLCPITETITKSGKPEYVTRTELSVVTKQVPVTYYTTIEKVDTKTAYTTFVKTAWEETKVYQTVTCPETVITTVSAGHTVYQTKTNTITKYITDVKTYTKNIPVTVTKNVDTVVAVTQAGGATVTDYHTVVVSVPNTIFSTAPPAPATTVVIPVTSSVAPTSVVTAGAAKQVFPAGAALVAGLVAALL